MKRIAFLLFVFWALVGVADQKKEPRWLPSLAYLDAPDCPNHNGTREATSRKARYSEHEIAYLKATAVALKDTCTQSIWLAVGNKSIPLQVVTRSLKEVHRTDIDRPNRLRGFEIVDFSKDGLHILLGKRGRDHWKDNTYRDFEIADFQPSKQSVPAFANTWDLMRWGYCRATVEAQGYESGGHPVLRVRPSVWQTQERNDCVPTPQLWSVNFKGIPPTKLDDATELRKSAQSTGNDWTTCNNDPDLVAACFTLHGKLFAANGGPSLRILRIGTKRILGVRTETIPENVPLNGFENEVFADFQVCPFTREKAGEMQMVCIESASHVVARKIDDN